MIKILTAGQHYIVLRRAVVRGDSLYGERRMRSDAVTAAAAMWQSEEWRPFVIALGEVREVETRSVPLEAGSPVLAFAAALTVGVIAFAAVWNQWTR